MISQDRFVRQATDRVERKWRGNQAFALISDVIRAAPGKRTDGPERVWRTCRGYLILSESDDILFGARAE